MKREMAALAMASGLLLVEGPAVGATDSGSQDGRGRITGRSTDRGAGELDGRIVFSRFGGELGLGGANPCWLWTADADGSNQECLFADESFLSWAAADGTRVVIGPAGIVDLIDHSAGFLDQPEGDTLQLFGGPFSRDGSLLALPGLDETDPTRTGIYITASGDLNTATQILQTNRSGERGNPFAVDFSPDGQQLVLYHQAPGDHSDTHGWLDIVNVDGTGLRRLTPEGIDLPCCASWSPDGERILFADLEGRMLTIDPAGGMVTELFAQEGGWVKDPDWSPDGSQIVFALDPVANLGTSPNVLYVINADGTGLRPIIETPDSKLEVQWVPDIRDDS